MAKQVRNPFIYCLEAIVPRELSKAESVAVSFGIYEAIVQIILYITRVLLSEHKNGGVLMLLLFVCLFLVSR